jgi:hypothetical protein
MNPFVVGAGMSLLPMLASQFMPQPQMPKGPDYSQAMAMLNTPQMSQARNAIMNNAFNPQNSLYQQASSQAMNGMNRQLAMRGMANSGMGLQAMSDQQSQLANNYYQNELNRQMQAYGAVTGPMQNMANMQMQQANGDSQNAMLGYNGQVSRQQGLMSGINSGMQAGMNAYQYNNMMDRMGY